ncbi:beta-glucan synthesis-associated protein [Friedmanniomyces endolithicus]|nr:beta-glucan synthesis-associated protein [Friedmanniomyces endolithicus]
MSSGFAVLNMTGLGRQMPATMRFDYVRIYQDDGGELTCDPIGYDTTTYIANHPEPYNNANLTTWASTGFSWPKNSFVDGCTAQTGSSSSKARKERLAKKRDLEAQAKAKRSWMPSFSSA